MPLAILIPDQKRTMFFSLPDELLIEIAKEASWRDILTLRQTCRRLMDITKSSKVWRCLASREFRQTLWLESSSESYSAEELEVLILRRKRADHTYEIARDGDILPQRILPITAEKHHNLVCLVPGGRWLLISNKDGTISYHDINSGDCAGHELIPATTQSRLPGSISVDVDLDSPVLKFNLALFRFEYPLNSEDFIEIWQVDLVVDERGKGVGLTANNPILKCLRYQLEGHAISRAQLLNANDHHT
ncbi:hypothetical protein BDN72DRAFT_280278 [Pluteus cervinus]|uniref:Uncharacterized protein n=1 Tax=Pluteus cervinus TaxID=181527 RepID=A0ACD3AH63_9AGAR|nr:hypothetical protein BDN72DRAFT_280278 [Pluteus cervinus]